ASKMLAAEAFGPSAAIYRAAAERYVQWVARVLDWTRSPRDPRAVAGLLSPKALALRLRELRQDAPEPWWARHGEPIARNLAELERVDRALPQQVVQNTAVRVLLRQQASEDALAWARHLGEFEREELSRRLEPGGLFGGGERDTGQHQTHWRRDYHVRPEEL